jgi:hypothetical protein
VRINLEPLKEKFERETGRMPSLSRVVAAAEFLVRHGLRIDQVRFERHLDRKWNERENRKPNERLAECVGATNARKPGDLEDRFWIVPKKA